MTSAELEAQVERLNQEVRQYQADMREIAEALGVDTFSTPRVVARARNLRWFRDSVVGRCELIERDWGHRHPVKWPQLSVQTVREMLTTSGVADV